MARLDVSGFELNSTTTDVEFQNVTGGIIQTGTVRSGVYAGECNPVAGSAFFRKIVYATASNRIGYQRIYINIASLPLITDELIRFSDDANNAVARMSLKTDGTLIIANSSNTQIGSPSSALNLNQWYCLELMCDATTSPGTVAGRLELAQFASGANDIQGSWNRVIIGLITVSTAHIYLDDWAINDDTGVSQTSWPGSGKVILLKPNAAGDANAFTRGGTDTGANFSQVNEIPPDDITTRITSATVNQEDLYNLDAGGLAASDVVNVVQVIARIDGASSTNVATGKLEIEKTASGTILQSAGITPNTTTWNTNSFAAPHVPALTAYNDPDGNPWTTSTIDSMQIGAKITTGNTNGFRVSGLYAYVDYTPGVASNPNPTGYMTTNTGFWGN